MAESRTPRILSKRPLLLSLLIASLLSCRSHVHAAVDVDLLPGDVIALCAEEDHGAGDVLRLDRKSTRLNSSHQIISYAVFCLKKKISMFDGVAVHQAAD